MEARKLSVIDKCYVQKWPVDPKQAASLAFPGCLMSNLGKLNITVESGR